MADTIFARIIRGEVPARIVHDDDRCLAFHDVAPQAPVHVLVIPKQPLPSLAEATATDADLLGQKDPAVLLDLLSDWAGDESLRRKILVDNPMRLYGFA